MNKLQINAELSRTRWTLLFCLLDTILSCPIASLTWDNNDGPLFLVRGKRWMWVSDEPNKVLATQGKTYVKLYHVLFNG